MGNNEKSNDLNPTKERVYKGSEGRQIGGWKIFGKMWEKTEGVKGRKLRERKRRN